MDLEQQEGRQNGPEHKFLSERRHQQVPYYLQQPQAASLQPAPLLDSNLAPTRFQSMVARCCCNSRKTAATTPIAQENMGSRKDACPRLLFLLVDKACSILERFLRNRTVVECHHPDTASPHFGMQF